MQSLIFKIFVAYWLAAGVVIFISDFEPHRHIHNPELTDALDASLAANGRTILRAYEAGDCSSTLRWLNTPEHGVYLATTDGRMLCGDVEPESVKKLIAVAASKNKRTTDSHDLFQMIATPVTGHDGWKYILLFKNSYSSALQVYGLLPGYTTMSISGVVTLFLGILVAFPIRRLRNAARRIASGKLDARVKPSAITHRFGFLGLQDDIDGLVNDFNGMAERLQSLVTAQKQLLRDVSHELRSPLARLAVALELIKQNAPETMGTSLARIERESVRLNTLIGRILSFSYVESTRELRHCEDLCLARLVEELLPDVQYEAEGRHCRIIATTIHNCVVRGDSNMLRHALENVVRNAISFTPAHGIVEIDVDSGEQNGNSVAVLRVTDRGPGVTEEKLELILNPFYRGDTTRRVSNGGFGVGLAIADHAAKLHDGKVVARNRQGGGLIVEIFLPLGARAS